MFLASVSDVFVYDFSSIVEMIAFCVLCSKSSSVDGSPSESTLSDKAKKKISEALKTMNKSLKEAKTLLEKYKSLYNKAVDEVNVFQELISNQLEYDEASYQKAVANVSEIGKEIEVTQATIDSLSLKIEHYNDVLNSKK